MYVAMKQEDKDLLLIDLCARLPYGVKISIPELWISEKKIEVLNEIFKGDDGLYRVNNNGMIIEYIKPYLFPLSSMTEEQYNSLYESGILDNCSHSYEYVNSHIHGVSFIFKGFKTYSLELIEWLNKNHFDYRGLIPMGLAIDCTNLNIY